MEKYYFVKTENNYIVWTTNISKDNIDRIEKKYGCKVISIEEDVLTPDIKVKPKSDENSRCMSDSNGSRMFQQGLNRFGY